MGKKKSAALHGLSKKERKALEAREAAIAAELAERAKRKAKKGKKGKAEKPAPVVVEKVGKGKKAKTRVVEIPEPTDAEARLTEAAADAKAERARRRAERKGEKGAPAAQAIAPEAKPSETMRDVDEEIKARVMGKRAERAALIEEAQTIDRADAEAVREYNMRAVKVGAMLLTSEFEKAKTKARKAPKAETFREELKAEGKLTEADDDPRAGQDFDYPSAHVADVVETDHGREIVVGPEAVEEFGQPSEAPRRIEDNTNGDGRYKIKGADGKERGHTRVTTYIDCLTDRTMLEKWKARIVLEGVAAIEEGGNDTVAALVREIAHVRDVTIKKGRKADKKGELGLGQLEAITSAAWSTFKKALDEIADEAFEVGGGREKAAKGTDIHELCALAVKDGIDAVGDKLTAGEITPADLADVESFLAALAKLGAKVLDVERVVVIDDLKVAGRLDYVMTVRLPGMLRASRVVADLKTGRVDYSTGKIAQQLEMYSRGEGYDEATGERTDLKLSRTKALLFHLPAGSAHCRVHVVDLGAGRIGNKLAGEVRAWRNTSKKSIDLKVDLLELADAEASAE